MTHAQSSRPDAIGADVGIPLRNLTFDVPADVPVHFVLAGNALATSLFAVLSGSFPPGERFFMRSVRRFRDRVVDPTLRAQVAGFLGQEAMHGREHERLNTWFAAQGFNMALVDRQIKLGLGLLSRLPERQQLACTAILEHFTASLAEQWLTDETFARTTDPRMLALWRWHALEELEHKSVAYDVYERIGNQRRERALAFVVSLVALLPGILATWAWLVARSGHGLRVRDHVRGLRFLFGKAGFLTKSLRPIPLFWAREFHPTQHDTRGLERAWRERMFPDPA